MSFRDVFLDTYNLTNRLFVFEEKEPIKVKGKPEPLKVYQLISARDLSQTQRGLPGMEKIMSM